MPMASSTDPGAPVRVSPRCIEQLSGWAAWRAPTARNGWPEPANDWRDDAAPQPLVDKMKAPARAPRPGALFAGFVTALALCALAGGVLG